MNTVFIPLKKIDSSYRELRFTLRSMQDCFGIDRLVICGHAPEGFTNFEHIPFPNASDERYKNINIYQKILKGFETLDSFIFANDDHFVSKEFIPHFNYYEGTLRKKSHKTDSSSYLQTIKNTIAFIGAERKYFDVHCPIIYKRDRFLPGLPNKHFGYCLKTIYGYYCNLSGVPIEDCKIRQPYKNYDFLNNKLFFSSSEGCMHKTFFDYLESRWPLPTKFEK